MKSAKNDATPQADTRTVQGRLDAARATKAWWLDQKQKTESQQSALRAEIDTLAEPSLRGEGKARARCRELRDQLADLDVGPIDRRLAEIDAELAQLQAQADAEARAEQARQRDEMLLEVGGQLVPALERIFVAAAVIRAALDQFENSRDVLFENRTDADRLGIFEQAAQTQRELREQHPDIDEVISTLTAGQPWPCVLSRFFQADNQFPRLIPRRSGGVVLPMRTASTAGPESPEAA